MGKKRITALFCAAVLAASSLPAAAEETAKVEMTADQALQSVTLVSDKDTAGVLIRADRASDGALNGVTLTEVTLAAEQEAVITHEDGLGAFDAGDKLMFVDSMESMRPLTDAVTIEARPIGTEPVDTPTAAPTEPAATPTDPVEEPTEAPTEAADEPTAEPTETPTASPTQSPKPTPVGPSTVEFSPAMAADDDENFPSDEIITNGYLPVYDDGGWGEPTRYHLADNLKIFVNGVEVEASNWSVEEYVYDNVLGNVKIIDSEGDGQYERMNIEYLEIGVVEYTETNNTGETVVYFDGRGSYVKGPCLVCGSNVQITDVNGESVQPADLKQYDVLTLTRDMDADLNRSSFYDIKLSRDTVTGVISEIDSDKNTVVINGETYSVIIDSLSHYDVGNTYTMYFDIDGNAIYGKKEYSETNYGIVTGMYEEPGSSLPTVRLITDEGNIIEERAANEDEADMFYTIISVEDDVPYSADERYDGGTYTLSDTVNDLQHNVCIYSASENGLKCIDTVSMDGEEGMKYREEAGRIDFYGISATETKFLNIEPYVNGFAKAPASISMADLEDGAEYTAYLGDRYDDIYGFCIIADGIAYSEPEQQEGTGVVTGIYTEPGNVLPTVRIMSFDGSVIEAEAENADEANRFFTLLSEAGSVMPESAETLAEYDGEIITRALSPEMVIDDIENNVCAYSISENGLSYKETLIPQGGQGMIYDAALGTLGSFALTDDTRIISLNEYAEGALKKPVSMTSDMLADQNEYSAYIYDNCVMLLEGEHSAGPKEEILSEGIGAVVGMYMAAGGEQPTVMIMTADGSIIEKEARDTAEANKFYALISTVGEVTSDDMTKEYDGRTYSKEDISLVAEDIQNNVCLFTVTESGLSLKEISRPEGGKGMVYDADSSMLGTYDISEADIIGPNLYLDDNALEASKIALSILEDGADYTAYVYNSGEDGRFVIITEGIGELRAESSIAIVIGEPRKVLWRGEELDAAEVYCNGAERTILHDELSDLNEGDIIAFAENENGVVEDRQLLMLKVSDSEYAALREMPTWNDNFAYALEPDGFDPNTNTVEYGDTDKEVKQYFGAIYDTDGDTVRLITSSDGEKSNVDDTLEFTIGERTNIYTYDYNYREGSRVFNRGKLDGYLKENYGDMLVESNYIDWNRTSGTGINPSFAYVKTVDGTVTDFVIFNGENE